VNAALLAVTALVPLLVGWGAGRRFERAARGWADYRARKAEVPILFAAARALSVRAVGFVFVAAVIAVCAVYLLATEGAGR